MKIISWDVGIKNLAYCIMEKTNKNDLPYKIHNWGILNSIEKSLLKELVVTDTIPLKEESSKIKVISVAEMFGDVMRKHVSFESISDHFVFANQ